MDISNAAEPQVNRRMAWLRRDRSAQEIIAADMSEHELLVNVIQFAEFLGYTAAHMRDSRRQAVEGWPDLVLGSLERRRVLFVELKREPASQRHTDLTPSQRLWRDILQAAGCEWYLWRPLDWLNGTVERILKAER